MTLAKHAALTVDMVPHLATLSRYAADADVIVELGTRTGVSTWAFLDGMRPDASLVSVDLDLDERVPRRVRTDPRWRFVPGDDRDPNVHRQLPHADLWLIDTSHEYHHTLEELALAARLSARRILLHDFAEPDVADAVRGFVDRTDWRIEMIEPSQWVLVGLQR